MAFSGTIVSAGQARGVVTATGVTTEIGRIQSLSDEAGSLAIGRFGHGMPFGELISAAIGFAVAAIPEGLPALVTITLALS